MAEKHRLRVNRANTVINTTSKKQEKELGIALKSVCSRLLLKFPGIELKHESNWLLAAVVSQLKSDFPSVDFHYYHGTSSMRPDGGILSIVDKKTKKDYPILIAEKKNQGTTAVQLRADLILA